MTQHFRRMVGGVELMALAFRLAVEVDAALDRIGCPSAQGIEVAPEIEAAVAVVAGVVVLEAEIEAVAIGESEAKAAHQVYRPVVLQVGLGDVRQYLVATAVVGRAVLLVGDGQAAVEQVVAAADRLRRAQVVILVALEAAAGAKLGVEASVAADALLGHDVDDPPVAPPPYTALAPDITSMRSMLNGSMESNCRLMPRELFSDTPSIITSTLRPRRFWPLLVRPWEPISRPGSIVPTPPSAARRPGSAGPVARARSPRPCRATR